MKSPIPAVELIKLICQIGTHIGVNKRRGTYDRTDPTEYYRFTLPIAMEHGFGETIPEVGLPAPEIVTIDYDDCTWGAAIKIHGESIKLEGYWDNDTGFTRPSPRWRQVTQTIGGRQTSGVGDEKMELINSVLYRLIMEGEWGNITMRQSHWRHNG